MSYPQKLLSPFSDYTTNGQLLLQPRANALAKELIAKGMARSKGDAPTTTRVLTALLVCLLVTVAAASQGKRERERER
jgi:hypothetical protein